MPTSRSRPVRMKDTERRHAAGARRIGPADPADKIVVIVITRQRADEPEPPGAGHWAATPHPELRFGLDNRPLAARAGGPPVTLTSLTPPDVAALYDFPPVPAGVSGQTVGIFEFGGGYAVDAGGHPADIDAFFAGLNPPLPPPVLTPPVPVSGGSNTVLGGPGNVSDEDAEVALDIDADRDHLTRLRRGQGLGRVHRMGQHQGPAPLRRPDEPADRGHGHRGRRRVRPDLRRLVDGPVAHHQQHRLRPAGDHRGLNPHTSTPPLAPNPRAQPPPLAPNPTPTPHPTPTSHAQALLRYDATRHIVPIYQLDISGRQLAVARLTREVR
jgi:hypothetical protein